MNMAGKRYIKIKAREVENIKNKHTDYRKYDELKSTKIVHTALEAAFTILLCARLAPAISIASGVFILAMY